MVRRKGYKRLSKSEFEMLRKEGIIKKGTRWTTWKKRLHGRW
jgi:hypothetical protein|tara:strand:- start:1493 stop:1618 length:126 start_codon:yes stop_codon:yes gene_type:complete